ncbi:MULTISPECIES: hypothetical protein [unclassified Shinella]|uniref:hypothetical protein n=1 Tax=unclassified Shinella TaxID=2643062 RepID=UPI00225CC284|nr:MULTISPECIES: hypothetical protein [unclassified Shinella]MCO5136332.1 hypothetical protein [Shinella sp.]MDC7253994.1 hypothetical protein [Shinella sp. YE25]CAI0336654.1 conserved hypothetical protein [Rhizobiaceae bacterium]CAK7255187.1 conserved protein of unknown function [Shinella sp. WSC3-e]
MATYKKVSHRHIRKETDLVVTLIEGIGGPCAFITDPAQARDTIPIPVEEALAGARQVIAGDPRPRNIVIVDEDDLWDDCWGTLAPHPERNVR